MTETSFVDSLLHPGFYKLGYVTNDRDQAVDVLSERLGIEEFVPFEPAFTVTTEDGRTGEASLRCAFSAGRQLVIEVLQPVDGLVDIFTESLTDSGGFQLVFHHVAVLVEDLGAVKKAAAALGLAPAIEAHLPTGMSFTYLKLPGLGHYVEHDQYDGDSGAFLDSVRGKRIAKRQTAQRRWHQGPPHPPQTQRRTNDGQQGRGPQGRGGTVPRPGPHGGGPLDGPGLPAAQPDHRRRP
ncbi:VOC family protein [Streptomyces phaeolivaceus]|uniref:VOC family protein n=1 Tax=Streptomyces phaeolivaceus TaxID=2653200 RepID=A0A5P8KF97_9ACTN|nr:VOC family protein [Streptomyces phaeolivaceus]QFR01691.1 VOC family protein [Streptomyces phaeolivaceus]